MDTETKTEYLVEGKSYSKKYTFQAEKGSKAEVRIEAGIKELCIEDLEEILHEFAACTHNFYLGLGKKIAGID